MRHLNPNCSKESLLSISLDTNTLPLATPASAVAYFTALPSPLLRHAAPRLVAGDANRRRRVVLPLGGSTTLLSLMHRNATPRDQRRRSACNPPWTPPPPRPTRVAYGAHFPFCARISSRSKLRAFIRCQPVAIASRRTASPPPSRETSAPLMRTGGASSPLICEVEQRPTAIMLVSETRAAVVKAPTRRRRFDWKSVIGED